MVPSFTLNHIEVSLFHPPDIPPIPPNGSTVLSDSREAYTLPKCLHRLVPTARII